MVQRRRPQNMMGQFQCPAPPKKGCGEWKDPHEFYSNKRALDGISTYCRDCHKKKQATNWSPKAKLERFLATEGVAQQDLGEQLGLYKLLLGMELGDEDEVILGGRVYLVTCDRMVGWEPTDEELETLKWSPDA